MADIATILVDRSFGIPKDGLPDFISFDSVTDVSESFANQITQYPTEFNGNISDHAYNRNPSFSFTGIITEGSKLNTISSEVDYLANNKIDNFYYEKWRDFFFQNEGDTQLINKVGGSLDKVKISFFPFAD